ncbi:MAG: hypothetical protein M5U26_30045 [Planctomycetota bacterium]|nr:hypothetical protein [Planctomycetota bacterium]
MGESLSGEQVKARHLRDLGSDLGPLYHALYTEVVWLHAKWLQYRQLFGHSAQRIDLLNRVAGHLVRIVQDTLWEDVLLSLARLTDRPEIGKRPNLTLQRLSGAISDVRLAQDVGRLVDDVLAKVAFARDWRNRHLAHRDLDLALDRAQPLEGASRAHVETALLSIRAVMNRIAHHYWKSETVYERFFAEGCDAESLLHYLAAGVRAEERRHGAAPRDPDSHDEA